MHWDGEVLVETGVHEDYVEHWVRDPGERSPAGALYLAGPDGAPALLVRVGAVVGWADGTGVIIGAERGELAISLSGNDIQANGVLWTVQGSEGNVDL